MLLNNHTIISLHRIPAPPLLTLIRTHSVRLTTIPRKHQDMAMIRDSHLVRREGRVEADGARALGGEGYVAGDAVAVFAGVGDDAYVGCCEGREGEEGEEGEMHCCWLSGVVRVLVRGFVVVLVVVVVY